MTTGHISVLVLSDFLYVWHWFAHILWESDSFLCPDGPHQAYFLLAWICSDRKSAASISVINQSLSSAVFTASAPTPGQNMVPGAVLHPARASAFSESGQGSFQAIEVTPQNSTLKYTGQFHSSRPWSSMKALMPWRFYLENQVAVQEPECLKSSTSVTFPASKNSE